MNSSISKKIVIKGDAGSIGYLLKWRKKLCQHKFTAHHQNLLRYCALCALFLAVSDAVADDGGGPSTPPQHDAVTNDGGGPSHASAAESTLGSA